MGEARTVIGPILLTFQSQSRRKGTQTSSPCDLTGETCTSKSGSRTMSAPLRDSLIPVCGPAPGRARGLVSYQSLGWHGPWAFAASFGFHMFVDEDKQLSPQLSQPRPGQCFSVWVSWVTYPPLPLSCPGQLHTVALPL
jgi:hypothetical protein